ncbi:alpha/beta hydrolase-fold protein [uncultured Clostridium sp.]|uniref:alpha/beta hydrolase n=1 Tax=uncultured Clostridium sp. TaxID=59620 RepID=UPI002622E53D|nr:alpha/beta hydrolase-fold protein [uncultured Clostridium sp.]
MNKSKIEKLTFYSSSLKKEMNISIYLPECYNLKTPLPVLYFLHGRSGDENIIFDLNVQSKADIMIKNKEISPMIIVCPNFENSRGLNSSLICRKTVDPFGRTINLGMYEDYFIKDIIPFIDKTFNTIPNSDNRYIGGASAGGYIALHTAFRHKCLFSKIGGHMPALELILEDEDKLYFSDLATWNEYDPLYIAKDLSSDLNFKIYLDAGNEDEGEFYNGCAHLQEILKEKNINSQNHIFLGHHNLEYINSNFEKHLKFYGNL